MLRGRLPDAVLDSYGSERSGHVQEMIGFSIELGKVICITDPAVAAARDQGMLAARAAPDYQPPPPPQPRLGAGLYAEDAPGSGLLAPQGMVEWQSRSGRFDHVVGRGFVLLARDAATLDSLSSDNRRALQSMGAESVHFGPDGVVDSDGTYGAYLTKLDSDAVLVRPDFYSYGAARGAASVNALVDHWRGSLGLTA